jgi:hypothetical protein
MKILFVDHNLLREVPLTITRFRRLESFNTRGNEIEHVPLQVRNFLRTINRRYQGHTIYQDSQNVHDSEVQHTSNASFEKLFKDTLEITLEQAQSEIVEDRPELECCLKTLLSQSDIHSTLNVTLQDVVLYVWNRVRGSCEMRELFFSEMSEVVNVCFTGRAVKLLNVLSGFYPDIEIKIGTNAQRNALLSQAVKKTTLEDAKNFFRSEMLERGETEETIAEWLCMLCENY